MRGPRAPGPFLLGLLRFNPHATSLQCPHAVRAVLKSRKPPAPLDIEGLLAYSARVLTARAQTTSELRQKLTQRAAQRGDVDEVIRRLKENGYLNDQRFAESFANWRRDNDGIGKIKVVRDLMARRIAPELAKKTAEAVYSGTDEIALIEQFLARKFRGRDLGALLQKRSIWIRVPPPADRRLQRGQLHPGSEALRSRSRTPGRNRRRGAARINNPKPTGAGRRTTGSAAGRRADLLSKRYRSYPIQPRVSGARWQTSQPAV